MILYRAFAQMLFGQKYESLKKTLPVYVIVFWGLHISEFQIRIAPFMLYFLVTTFTAGVMWQALSSKENAARLKNMFMLPFEEQKFVFSYVSALGTYTLLTKTAGLFAVVLGVSSWEGREVSGSILCAVDAVLMTAFIHAQKKYRGMGVLWAGVTIAAIFLLWDAPVFFPVVIGNGLLALLLLGGVDAYSFYRQTEEKNQCVKTSGKASLWRYLFRYLTAHKNYLANMAVLCGVACVMPAFFVRLESQFVIPIGCAVLSLNTPICILLSCDPDLEQAVRSLPGQKRAFCVPYSLFIFLCSMTADAIFLCSYQIQIGGVGGGMLLTAVCFALQSAIGSVLLEWFCPVRGWKIESDLWHHPRKYVVPSAMLLLAGIVGTLPRLLPLLLVLLLIETAVLLFLCRRC